MAASSRWAALGETFYRREEIYSMQWPLQDLSDYLVAGARAGGPLAVLRDDRKPILLGTGMLGKPRVNVYTSAGGLLQTIAWDSPTRIVALGWTLAESLVILTHDGTYRLYPLSTTPGVAPYSQHSLGPEAAETSVLDARIYEEGMVVLLGSLAFVEVRGWEKGLLEGSSVEGSRGGKVVALANAGLTEAPSCWCVITPDLSNTRGVEVLIGTGVTILRLDEIEVQDQRVNRGPFLNIVPSPNGRFLSLLSTPIAAKCELWVTSSDFTRSLSEFDLGSEGETGPPSQIVWCGSNTVVVAWDRTVVMVGPFGETLKYFYSDPVYLLGEIDGTRIVSRETCEFLQKVPQSSQDVFLPGSTSPAAILFEAMELFEKRSPKADEQIRMIRPELVSAVDTCIDAAGREFESHWQKKLLKAATFGKTFLDLYNPTDFVQMTQTLRVLNAARFYEVGIPLTYDQYQSYPPTQLILRLTLRSQHLLAMRIAEFLKLSPAPVLKHWAQAKIESYKGDSANEEDEICRAIVEKLSEMRDVSCADVALTAWNKGRGTLATKLLNHEPRASKQVPLLLSMKEYDLSLVKAIESGDPNLVYTVLISLRRTHSLSAFFKLIDKKPIAISLLQVYARENDVELLKDFYYQDDRRREMAMLALEEGASLKDFGERVSKVREAAKSFGEDKESGFEAKMVEEQIRLLALQQALEQEAGAGNSYVGLSVNATMHTCIVRGLGKKAEKVRSDFKVPDKRWWYVKLSALIALRDWEALETFAKSKKSPISYEPFVQGCLRSGNNRQALTFVARCEPKNRIELYVKCGEWEMAGQEAKRRNERNKLLDLRSRAPNSAIAAQLGEMLEGDW